MIHATINALRLIYDWTDIKKAPDDGEMLPSCSHIQACDWEAVHWNTTAFVKRDAYQLLGGDTPGITITCPKCAVLLDVALELRGRCS